MHEFIRIGIAVPPVRVGDTEKNAQDICAYIQEADARGCDLVLFPELAITGYTCADLFFQSALLKGAVCGLQRIVDFSKDFPDITAIVGLPAVLAGQIYNCATVVSGGTIHGIVPKTYLPNYNEFYECRWFSSSKDLMQTEVAAGDIGLKGDARIPVGTNLLFRIGDGTMLGVEICEDLWTPMPPSTLMALNGAEVIVNLSASNETVGKRSHRRDLVKYQASSCNCIYAYCSAGSTESTQDLVFSGHSILAQNGKILCENQNEIDTDYLLVHDADLGRIREKRRHNMSIRDGISFSGSIEPMKTVDCRSKKLRSDGTLYTLDKCPFVPSTVQQRTEHCQSIFNIQVAGLKQRLSILGANAVVGVSGGLDSTLALLVAVEAMRRLGRPATDVYGVTLPCFGTSNRTYQNAWKLMHALGVSTKEIDIRNAVENHFVDIGHDANTYDATYENAQARERTQVLMDYAGMVNGLVVGTADLSELALGWCTYNADHMSMYGVNASVPKTLIRLMLEMIAQNPAFEAAKAVLLDIVNTPISPELLPPDGNGEIAQETETLVGPYVLHDFFLYHMLHCGFVPEKIYYLACRAFSEDYDKDTVKKWLKIFYRRFFSQQFKRNCMPDGVKVGPVCLNPRGYWRMPSDASARLWLEEIESL